jgi:UDP-glucuronate 4-epimerase
MTRVLVTGAAGFIGSHLVEALLARGDAVCGVDNFDPLYPRAAKEANLAAARRHAGFEFHEQDVLDAGSLAERLDPGTVVVHLAARAGVRPSIADPAGYARTNVEGTAAVLAAMRRAGATRLVFGSSSSVYGDDTPAPFAEAAAAIHPISPYGATKRAGEMLIGSLVPVEGLRAVSLRFFTVYGPRQRPDLAIHAFARRMARGEVISLFGDGTSARDYTYCDDIVRGIIAAMDLTGRTAPGHEIVNLGGRRAVALDEMAEAVARATGLELRVERAPAQPGDVRLTSADTARAERVLGWRPEVGFEEGLRRFAAWFREQPCT